MRLLNNKTGVNLMPYVLSAGLFLPITGHASNLSYDFEGLGISNLFSVSSLTYQILDLKKSYSIGKPTYSRKSTDKRNTGSNKLLEVRVKSYTQAPLVEEAKTETKIEIFKEAKTEARVQLEVELPKSDLNEDSIAEPKSILSTILSEIQEISDKNAKITTSLSNKESKVTPYVSTNTNKYSTYVVQDGDNLTTIGKKLDLDWKMLGEKNGIFASNNYRIYSGQVLNLGFDANLESRIQREETKVEVAKTEKTRVDRVQQLEYKLKPNDVEIISPEVIQTVVLNLNKSEGCYNVDIVLRKSKPIHFVAQNTNLSLVEVKSQLGVKSNKLNPGVYSLCVKKDENTGYIPLHHEHNWKHIKTKSGAKIWSERKKLGVFGLGKLIGVQPGNCFSKIKDTDTILAENRDIFDEAQKQFNVDANVLASISKIESGGNSKCLSPTGALGSMGLTRYYYNDLNLEPINPFNKKEAVFRAAEKLSVLLEKYNHSYHLALAAYNQGEEVLDTAIEIAKANGITNNYEVVRNYLPTKEGKNYSRLVLTEAKMIKRS